MTGPKDFGRSMNMDSRMVDEISRSQKLSSEQGPGWLSDYGGAQGYVYWSRQPLNERATYFAVQEGYTTPQDIADVTDLKVGDVSRALTVLGKKGFVTEGVVSK